jgi:hypothetical protein
VWGWLRSSKFLERWSVKALLYVIKKFIIHFLFLSAALAQEANTSVRGLHYVLINNEIYFLLLLFYFYEQHIGLNCERLCMARLDDSSILQPEHLVWNRLRGTHDSISIQTLRSHSYACGSSHAMYHVTKEHLAWHDLRKTQASRGTRYPTILEDQGL